ncbi:BH0955 [Halalkalibacterium halodurans C-125]|uniref:BH0955 protein n=2 Tax=Halalkalibacterium halodurans TaxID=86665 RepID=Q9KEA1_HALH5|nr:BH0955 [Halalkalibacterium halodurans C-125]
MSMYDKEAKIRRYSTRYHSLGTSLGVRRLLRDYHTLKERRYDGDYVACDVLTDLEIAISLACLTMRQKQTLALIYIKDLTQKTAAEQLGLRQDTISRHEKAAIQKVAAVYQYWTELGEGYELTGGLNEKHRIKIEDRQVMERNKSRKVATSSSIKGDRGSD